MDKDVNIEGSLLINGKPGKAGEVISSRGAEKTPAWVSFSKSLEKSNKAKTLPGEVPPGEEPSAVGKLAGAAKDEITSRITGVLSEAFPLLTAAPYMRAIRSLPGVDLTTSIIQKSGILNKKEQAVQEQAEQKQEVAGLEQESFSILEKILDEVVEIRKVIAGPLLKEGYVFEEGKGKGRGGFKSLATGRYVKEGEATAEPVARSKMGVAGAAKRGVKLAKSVASGQALDNLKAGAGRLATGALNVGRAAVGVAAGGLKLGAILTALAMFLPKDMKSVIGSIFEGLLQGLGFDKDTIEAIFVPFRILSDIAEVIKKVIGLAWDFVKWIFKSLGNIIDWFSGRSKVNAAEEVSKATGGTGHGEFTTGGEGAAETVPIPSTEPPPAATPIPPGSTTGARRTAAPERAADQAPAAAQVPPSPPVAAAAAPAAIPTMTPSLSLDKEVSEYLNKPENAVDKMQFEQINARIVTFKDAIATAKSAISSEKDPEKKKNYEFVLKRQLEPGLASQEQARDLIIEKAKKATGTAAAPVSAPSLPSTSLAGAAESAAGGGGGGAGAGGGGGGGAGALSTGDESGGGASAVGAQPAAQLEASEPVTGQQIDRESMNVEAARDEMPSNVSSEVIENGEIAAGTVTEDTSNVPSPSAPRGDLDADIFFSALAY